MSLSITIIIIIITVGASLWAWNDRQKLDQWILNPYLVVHHKQYWRVLTHGLIHKDQMHLFFNMFVFYSFGEILELVFTNRNVFIQGTGSRDFWGESTGLSYFIILYVGAIIAATIPGLVKHKDNPGYNSLGASGAVSAILIVYILMFPTHQLLLFFIIPMPAWLAGVLFFVYESYMAKRGGTGIAHDAHLWGALFGAAFITILRPDIWWHFITELPFVDA
ncbi:rhomboid family intramembrane serine protease [Sanyastnella coralliicola]|uniref:rhomboid family intramembrane serine protease n=1 Tax=Sanyastnella coralliicola TaxID=3069118 RepID=UPI0027BAB802|nr:rhomboid family intramembrane serine protease [Longitalea sp. SCSIO 12813]